jgi:hypothetical protein
MHALVLGLLALGATAFQPGTLGYTAPATWKSRPASSSMRVAEFVVPRAAGDSEDAEVVIFFFGGTGGSVDANIARWIGQFQQDGGGPAKSGQRSTFTVGNLKVTTVDVSGTYVAEVRPGSGTRLNKPKFQMRAAVVETPGGPYFVKFTGPQATVAQGLAVFDSFLKSLRFK